jgi:hypothetical protein
LPVIVRTALAGQTNGALSCLAGAVFLPSFAAFLGEFTKTRRVFEIAFIVMTYIILNNAPAFMYMAAAPETVSPARSGIYLAAGIAAGAAVLAKRTLRQSV